MSTAAAAILVANFNISRSGTGTATISENDVSKFKRVQSDVSSMKKPPAPKVSPRNRDRKFTHTGIVERKDIDSTPKTMKKLDIVTEASPVPTTIFTNQTAKSVPVGAAVASGAAVTTSPTSG